MDKRIFNMTNWDGKSAFIIGMILGFSIGTMFITILFLYYKI